MSTAPRRPNPGVTWRALLLAALLIPVNVAWVTVVEVRWYSLDGCELPLFVTPIFILFLLVLANLGLHRLKPRWALTQGELLATYIMVVISCTIAGHDMWQNLFGAVSHPFYFATPENRWEELFFKYLPRWLAVRDPDLLKGFYQGNAQLTWQVWSAWARPLVVWGSLVVGMVLTMLCLNVLIRRQWTENERLTYPIVQVPLALTEQLGVPFLRNPVMWYGFSLPVLIGLFCGMHAFFPAVPTVNIKLTSLHRYLTGRPWDFMGQADMSFYPFMIGLAYFLPLDLAFSCWFFYVVRLLQQIVGGLMGGDTGRFFPFLPEQAAGSWLALAFIAIWGARYYLADVGKQVFRGQRPDEEPLSYRWASAGVVGGMIFLVWWSTRLKVGVPFALAFWIIFMLLSIAMTRVRAELGAPHEIYFVNPRRIMFALAGTSVFRPEELTFLSASYWFNRCYRCHPMPPQIEAFKMAEHDRLHSRRLFWAILAATVYSLWAASWTNLHVCYTSGAVSKCGGFKAWVGWESYNDLSRWLTTQTKPDTTGIGWMTGAFVFTVLCNSLRRRFLWWPFHPAGYPLAVSFAMDYFWFAVFVAWLIKWVVLRVGGMRLYRKGIPFALGMILGDYFIGSVWAIIGPALGITNYKIFI